MSSDDELESLLWAIKAKQGPRMRRNSPPKVPDKLLNDDSVLDVIWAERLPRVVEFSPNKWRANTTEATTSAAPASTPPATPPQQVADGDAPRKVFKHTVIIREGVYREDNSFVPYNTSIPTEMFGGFVFPGKNNNPSFFIPDGPRRIRRPFIVNDPPPPVPAPAPEDNTITAPPLVSASEEDKLTERNDVDIRRKSKRQTDSVLFTENNDIGNCSAPHAELRKSNQIVKTNRRGNFTPEVEDRNYEARNASDDAAKSGSEGEMVKVKSKGQKRRKSKRRHRSKAVSDDESSEDSNRKKLSKHNRTGHNTSKSERSMRKHKKSKKHKKRELARDLDTEDSIENVSYASRILSCKRPHKDTDEFVKKKAKKRKNHSPAPIEPIKITIRRSVRQKFHSVKDIESPVELELPAEILPSPPRRRTRSSIKVSSEATLPADKKRGRGRPRSKANLEREQLRFDKESSTVEVSPKDGSRRRPRLLPKPTKNYASSPNLQHFRQESSAETRATGNESTLLYCPGTTVQEDHSTLNNNNELGILGNADHVQTNTASKKRKSRRKRYRNEIEKQESEKFEQSVIAGVEDPLFKEMELLEKGAQTPERVEIVHNSEGTTAVQAPELAEPIPVPEREKSALDSESVKVVHIPERAETVQIPERVEIVHRSDQDPEMAEATMINGALFERPYFAQRRTPPKKRRPRFQSMAYPGIDETVVSRPPDVDAGSQSSEDVQYLEIDTASLPEPHDVQSAVIAVAPVHQNDAAQSTDVPSASLPDRHDVHFVAGPVPTNTEEHSLNDNVGSLANSASQETQKENHTVCPSTQSDFGIQKCSIILTRIDDADMINQINCLTGDKNKPQEQIDEKSLANVVIPEECNVSNNKKHKRRHSDKERSKDKYERRHEVKKHKRDKIKGTIDPSNLGNEKSKEIREDSNLTDKNAKSHEYRIKAVSEKSIRKSESEANRENKLARTEKREKTLEPTEVPMKGSEMRVKAVETTEVPMKVPKLCIIKSDKTLSVSTVTKSGFKVSRAPIALPTTPVTPTNGKLEKKPAIVGVVDMFSSETAIVKKKRPSTKKSAMITRPQESGELPPPLPPGWKRTIHTRAAGASKGKRSVVFISPAGKRFDRKSTLQCYLKSQRIPYDATVFNFAVSHSATSMKTKPISQGKCVTQAVKEKQSLKAKLKAINTKNIKITKLRRGWRKVTRFSCGRHDSFYYSPEGRRIRSKPEMTAYLKSTGSRISLADIFNMENGPEAASTKSLSPHKKKPSELNSVDPIRDHVPTIAPVRREMSVILSSPQKAAEQAQEKGFMYNDPRLPAGWRREMHVRSSGGSVGRVEVYIISPDGKKMTNRTKLRHYLKVNDLPHNAEDFDFSCYGTSTAARQKRPVLQEQQHNSKVHPHRLPVLQDKPSRLLNPKPATSIHRAVLHQKPPTSNTKLPVIIDDAPECEPQLVLFGYLNLRPEKKEESPIDLYRRIARGECRVCQTCPQPVVNLTFIESVRALVVASGVSTARAERRNAALYLGMGDDAQPHTFTGDEDSVPAAWVANLISTRPELAQFDASAVEKIANATEEFVRRLAEVSYQLARDKKVVDVRLDYADVAETVARLPCLEPMRILIPRRLPAKLCRKLAHPSRFFSFSA